MGTSETVSQINTFLQEKLAKDNLAEVAAVTAAQWLDKAGILQDSVSRPGKALRDLLRDKDKAILGATQRPAGANGRWFIVRSGKVAAPPPAPGPEAAAAPAPPSPAWQRLHDQPRHTIHSLKADPQAIPNGPGVYTIYRDGRPVYLGKTAGNETLRQRLSRSDLQTGQSLRESSFRSNVAESLGFGQAKDLVQGSLHLTASQMGRVDEWVNGCQVSWISCNSEQQAIDLMRKLRSRKPSRA